MDISRWRMGLEPVEAEVWDRIESTGGHERNRSNQWGIAVGLYCLTAATDIN